MATKVTHHSEYNVPTGKILVGGVVVALLFLVWKLWPALSRRAAGSPGYGGGGTVGGGGGYGYPGYPSPGYGYQPQSNDLLSFFGQLIGSLLRKGGGGGGSRGGLGSGGSGGGRGSNSGSLQFPSGFNDAVQQGYSDLYNTLGVGDYGDGTDSSQYSVASYDTSGLDSISIPYEDLQSLPLTATDFPSTDNGSGGDTSSYSDNTGGYADTSTFSDIGSGGDYFDTGDGGGF